MRSAEPAGTRNTALHEAAHVVAHVRLHPEYLYIGDISIVPNVDRETLGHAAFEQLTDEPREVWSNEVLVLCAGYAAEVQMGEDPDLARQGAEWDLEKAETIIAAWQMEPLDEHIQVVSDLINRPENRQAIERIAGELATHGTLDAYEIAILIDVVDGEASENDLAIYRSLKSG